MLATNPSAEYLLFDTGQNISTRRRMDYVRQAYPNTKIEVVYGPLAQSIQQYIDQHHRLYFTDLCHLNTVSDRTLMPLVTKICQNDGLVVIDNMKIEPDEHLTQISFDHNQFVGQSHHSDPVDYLSKIIYVNLDKRPDRRKSLCNSMVATNIKLDKIERFPAILGNPGYFGCCRSHREALVLARDRGYQNVLMLEDDFVFDVSRAELDYYLEYLFADFNQPWDVIMFVYNLIKAEPYQDNKILGRAVTATTGAGYLVNGHYLPTLIKNFEEAWPLLCSTNRHWLYVCDRSWATLQQKDKWFYFLKPLGRCCDGGASDGGYH